MPSGFYRCYAVQVSDFHGCLRHRAADVSLFSNDIFSLLLQPTLSLVLYHKMSSDLVFLIIFIFIHASLGFALRRVSPKMSVYDLAGAGLYYSRVSTLLSLPLRFLLLALCVAYRIAIRPTGTLVFSVTFVAALSFRASLLLA